MKSKSKIKFALGGPAVTTRSRFIKADDVYRGGSERQDYGKTTKGGELAKTEGESKRQKPNRGSK